jgi:hypothetical protein
VNANAYSRLFSHRGNFLDERGEVLPYLLFRIVPLQLRPATKASTGNGLFLQPVHIKSSRAGPTPSRLARSAPDPVCHVSIGGIGNVCLTEIPQVLLVFLHLLIASRKVEGNRSNVVNATVP